MGGANVRKVSHFSPVSGNGGSLIMSKLNQLIATFAESFETRQRKDEAKTEYVVLKDTAPDWCQDVVFKAHGNMGPDDQRYACVSG